MADAGFNIKKDPQSFPTWLDNYTNLKYDASLSLNQVYETAQFELDFQHSEGPARNHIYAVGVGAVHPEVDQAIDESKSITDPVAQAKKVQDVQRLIYTKGPAFLPIVTPYAFTLYQKYVKSIPVALGAASERFINTWYLDK
jgi:ABC-type transport system substrate-binding protein